MLAVAAVAALTRLTQPEGLEAVVLEAVVGQMQYRAHQIQVVAVAVAQIVVVIAVEQVAVA